MIAKSENRFIRLNFITIVVTLLADQIRNDKSIILPEEFNPAKTWTEYINRLTGAILGVFLLLTAIYSFTYRKAAKRVIVLSILNVLLTGYQGWLGSIVVSTNLTQWVVTLHMLLAIVILGIAIYTYNYAKQLHKERSVIMYRIAWLKGFLAFTIFVTIVQIILGTEVRESIDEIAKSLSFGARDTWIAKIGSIFSYHRDLAILVAICNFVVYKMVVDRFSGKAWPLLTANYIIVVLIVQVVSGILLNYLSLPPYAQAIHILFATLMFSLQYYLYLLVYRTATYKPS
jgi:cytochrome c oxidase assembly protein subunit 15